MTPNMLMLTSSSSGSKWLAGLIAKHMPGVRYYDKEFFNPICNLRHELTLRKNFGCELVSCYRNIALPGDRFIHDDIRATWGQADYTFTKECYSACKLPVLVEHFKCFVLVRRTEELFPPMRVRVWSFYEHVWFALREAGYPMKEVSTVARAMEAHKVEVAVMQRDATRLGVPVLHFDDLMDDAPDALARRLEHTIGFCSEAMVAELVATRYREVRT
jgi:hypothetical protein